MNSSSFVAHKIVELDPRKPGGISFLTSGFGEAEVDDEEILDSPKEEKKIRYAIEDARVDKVLTDLAGHFRVEFHVTSIGIVVTPTGGNPFPNAKAEAGAVYYTYQAPKGEQDGAEQPATAPESKSDGKEKPKPESEERSQ